MFFQHFTASGGGVITDVFKQLVLVQLIKQPLQLILVEPESLIVDQQSCR
ncbi:MAG: hypothetical protein AAGI37_09205 [Planctomycetota bacterium]